MSQQKDFEERFWSNVEIRGLFDCWEWKGYIGDRGYGRFPVNRRCCYSHRIAYTLIYGVIPKKHYICHTCDNPKCVNPAHLFLGTPSDNAKDRNNKGRNANIKGEKNINAKSTDKEIAEIIGLIKSGTKIKDIARLYNMKDKKIYNIKNNRTWKHIPR